MYCIPQLMCISHASTVLIDDWWFSFRLAYIFAVLTSTVLFVLALVMCYLVLSWLSIAVHSIARTVERTLYFMTYFYAPLFTIVSGVL